MKYVKCPDCGERMRRHKQTPISPVPGYDCRNCWNFLPDYENYEIKRKRRLDAKS